VAALGCARTSSRASVAVRISPPPSLGIEPLLISESPDKGLTEGAMIACWSGTRYGPMYAASLTVSPVKTSFGVLDFLPRPMMDTVTTAFFDARLLHGNDGLANLISMSSERMAGHRSETCLP